MKQIWSKELRHVIIIILQRCLISDITANLGRLQWIYCTYCDIGKVETGTNVFYIHAVEEGG